LRVFVLDISYKEYKYNKQKPQQYINAENGNLLQYFPADHSGFVHLFIPFYDK
jgi:hypothetical protein